MSSSMTNILRERIQRMKTETDALQSGSVKDSRPNVSPAPSLRVPVTAGNRAFLRWLRAAELLAWEAGLACKSIDGSSPAAAAPDVNCSIPNSTYQNI